MKNSTAIQALYLLATIAQAIHTAGPTGAPSGAIYMALSEKGYSLEVYYQLLSALRTPGFITGHDLLRWNAEVPFPTGFRKVLDLVEERAHALAN